VDRLLQPWCGIVLTHIVFNVSLSALLAFRSPTFSSEVSKLATVITLFGSSVISWVFFYLGSVAPELSSLLASTLPPVRWETPP
jgi:hypothetical protein